MTDPSPKSLEDLAAVARALGARDVPGLSEAEGKLLRGVAWKRPDRRMIASYRRLIRDGQDPLGEAFCRLRAAVERRPLGATYTPDSIVTSMVDWAADFAKPARVIDPGTGSARFAMAAARRFPRAHILGAEVDPLAALLARANLATSGFAKRSRVELVDYRKLRVEEMGGRTLFLGNPPYVRHHQIEVAWKKWLSRVASDRGLEASQLAGLHVHFFLATAVHGRPGDFGAFITSSEWLDVNYGALVRALLLDGLGGEAVHLLDPTVMPFDGVATTGVITCFNLESRAMSVRLKRHKSVNDLGALSGGRPVSKQRLAEARRWTPLLRASPKLPEGFVELGELCRVHRGAVTGANRIWVTHAMDTSLPSEVLFPSVTKAKELFQAGSELASLDHLRRVIDLPEDLDVFEPDDRKHVEAFIRKAKKAGAADGYIARNRKAWWSVGLRIPAPILTTYMARRPPAFVMNTAEARHINIAHGLYPRVDMNTQQLTSLADALRNSVQQAQGRTYAGGLTKFEPKEVERLPVPAFDFSISS